jgi:hypothetical protein
MTSTSPVVTPQLTDITTSVRDASIQNGVFLPTTSYSVLNGSTNTIAQDLDDLAKQSNYSWRIFNKQLVFQARNAQLSPWILTGNDIILPQGQTQRQVQVDNVNNLYRNSAWILGGTDTVGVTQPFTADGIAQSWTMDLPIEALASVTVDGQTATFGIQGVDTGKQFYYTINNNTVTQDLTQPPFLNGQVLVFSYNAITNVVVNSQNTAEIAARALLEGTSGMVEVAETAQGLNNAAATQFAQSRLVQYALNGQTLQFTTLRSGLIVGQLLTAFLPQHGIADQDYIVSDCQTVWKTLKVNGITTMQPFYQVQATSGPLVPQWSTYQAGLNK